MDDAWFAQLLEFMGGSWKGFRKVRKGVKKRVARHMQSLGCRSMDDYLERITSDPAARAECERLMTVSISRFFRDLRLWEIIETRVLPEILQKTGERVRVWFAGCAGGEEVYSFKIVWERLAAAQAPLPALVLIATDLNPENLERARQGIYPKGALRELDTDTRELWFEPAGKDRFAVKPHLKEGIVWQKKDLLHDDPPGSAFDIVFLRNNLLTYYTEAVMQEAFHCVVDAVAPDGFLVIGAKEEMPEEGVSRLARFDRYVYRKKG